MLVQGRRHVGGGLAVLIAALVIVSAQFMAAPLKAADPIKVGWVGPLSPPGGYAEGALMKQAAELAAEEINAKGGCSDGRSRSSSRTRAASPRRARRRPNG